MTPIKRTDAVTNFKEFLKANASASSRHKDSINDNSTKAHSFHHNKIFGGSSWNYSTKENDNTFGFSKKDGLIDEKLEKTPQAIHLKDFSNIKKNFFGSTQPVAYPSSTSSSITFSKSKKDAMINDTSPKGYDDRFKNQGISAFQGFSNRVSGEAKNSNYDFLNKKRSNSNVNSTALHEFKQTQGIYIPENSSFLKGLTNGVKQNSSQEKINCKKLGLKDISKRVVDIIKTSGETTYKEISDSIVGQVEDMNTNDSKNIRRRIYDALNVLKAINIFKVVDSKKIIYSKSEETNQIDNLKDELRDMQEIVNLKKTQFNKLEEDKNVFSELINNNRTTEMQCNSKEDKKIQIPFLTVSYHKKNSSIVVNSSKDKTRVHISNTLPLIIEGDYDIVKRCYSSIK